MKRLLKVLCDQLCSLHFGVKMSTYTSTATALRNTSGVTFSEGTGGATSIVDEGVYVRAVLYNNLCDLPVARRIASFTGFCSTRAYPRCDRSFKVFPGTKLLNYSGFLETDYPRNANKRLNDIQASKWASCKTKTGRRYQDAVRRAKTTLNM